MAVLPYPI